MNENCFCVSLHPSLPFEGKTGITDYFIVTFFITTVKSITLEAHEGKVF